MVTIIPNFMIAACLRRRRHCFGRFSAWWTWTASNWTESKFSLDFGECLCSVSVNFDKTSYSKGCKCSPQLNLSDFPSRQVQSFQMTRKLLWQSLWSQQYRKIKRKT